MKPLSSPIDSDFNSYRGSGTEGNTNNNNFFSNEKAFQQNIIDEQDQHMDSVLNTVLNMKEIAKTMNNELDDQQRLLGNLDNRVDSAQTRLKGAASRIADILKGGDSDCKRFTVIVILMIIVIFLIIKLIF